ncbi:MAG: IPT/TIG domain-containing protein [Candidatus Nomurabacteria bacterium]|jgi:hypothetical protein|nr:IPT/TIG domain-containing protein [Candidatus Nomurabacteria bacterium]
MKQIRTAKTAFGEVALSPNFGPTAGGNSVTISAKSSAPFMTDYELGRGGKIVPAIGHVSYMDPSDGYNYNGAVHLVGTSTRTAAMNCADYSDAAYYRMSATLTSFNSLEYYVKQGAPNGMSGIYIDTPTTCEDSTLLNKLTSSELTSEWRMMSLDLTNYTGYRTLYFLGGHTSQSGNPNSETIYSAIRFADYPSAVTFGGTSCATPPVRHRDFDDSADVTCLAPPHTAVGSVDVAITASRPVTAQRGYTYIDYTKYLLIGGALTVTVRGEFSGLSASDISLTIGGQACSGLVIVNNQTATCHAPTHPIGQAAVTLRIRGSSVSDLAISYYELSPTSGSTAGGTEITVGGIYKEEPFDLSLTGQAALLQAGIHSSLSSIQPNAGYLNTTMIDFIGTSRYPSSQTSPPAWSNAPQFYRRLDLTDVNAIKFHARKIRDHGGVYLAEGSTMLFSRHYTEIYNSEWQAYSVDLSNLDGLHTVGLLGGYTDSSGNAYSQTQMSNINLVKNAITGVKLGGQTCTNFHIQFAKAVCQTPPHAGGPVDVVLTTSIGETITIPNGFTYRDAISLSLNKTALNMAGSPNQLLSDNLTTNVITDNSTGYHLDIESSQPNLLCNLAGRSYQLNPTASPTLNNSWGYALSSGGPNPPASGWKGVTNAPVAIKNHTTATDLVSGDNTVIWFGAKADYSLPACRYSGTVTLTATVNR